MEFTMKRAFTLLELVFVIVVIGILAAIVIPNIKSDRARDAAFQLVSHIRYTQHLAMIDDKFNMNDSDWYKKRWTIIFNSDAYTDNNESYTIFNDLDADGNPDLQATFKEVAIDPLNKEKYMSGGFTGENDLDIRDLDSAPENFKGIKKLNLGKSYGVTSVVFSGSCQYHSSKRIAFDSMGRPLIGDISGYSTPYVSNRLLESRCTITLVTSESNATVAIEPETGYAHIL